MATFGAQINADDTADNKKVDYYAIAHRISKKVTRQPNILVGGKLKYFQVKRSAVDGQSLQQPS